MTTVAYHNGTLASDSRTTSGTMITSDNSQKLYVLNNHEVYINGDRVRAVGLAGTYAYFDAFIEWLDIGRTEEFHIEESCGVVAILVGEKWVYECEDVKMPFCRFDKKEKLAIGSGAKFAISALHMGLNVKDAIKHAIKLDAASGGKIQLWQEKSR